MAPPAASTPRASSPGGALRAGAPSPSPAMPPPLARPERPPSVPLAPSQPSLTQLFAPKDSRASPLSCLVAPPGGASGRSSSLGGRSVVGCFGGLGGAFSAATSPSPTPLTAPSPTPSGPSGRASAVTTDVAAAADGASTSAATASSSLGLKKFRSGAVSPAPPSLVNTGGRGGLRSTSNISFKVRSATPTTVD